MADINQTNDTNQTNTSAIFKPGDIVLNQYKIIKEIGHGGMNSVIYLAEDTTVDETQYFSIQNKNVAIKVVNRNELIKESEWTKFLDECVTSSRATNLVNIVKTYQVDKINDGNTVIIVMEYIDGISLRQLITQRGSLSVAEAIYLFEKILIGIRELHSFHQKIIHRDLKPENILLSKDLRSVKIIDFGISSVVDVSTYNNEKQVLTEESALYGTYPYISPDIFQMVGENNNVKSNLISEQFDFFSLGIIFYEMLTGKKPFIAKDYNSVEVIKLPLTYDIPIMSNINPEISPAIENIIFRCIASKPEDIKFRYHSIKEIIEDLERVKNVSPNAIVEELLKPKKKRSFQNKNIFDIEKQKSREKYYEKWWFFWLIALVSMVVIGITIILHYFVKV